MTWMIIDTDNFGGDHPNEKLVASQIPTLLYARTMAKAMNDVHAPGESSSRYFKVEQEGYVLVPGFEP